MRHFIPGGILALAFLVAGCRSSPTLDIPEGCASGDDVPPEIQASIEAAGQEFYARARQGEWEAIYQDASTALRTQRSRDAFVTPIRNTFDQLGFPAEFRREAITVVKFGPGFPPSARIKCKSPGETDPVVLMLPDFPMQASLVARGKPGADEFFYSTLWHREGSRWKVASFFAKPATLLGKSWQDYEAAAKAQRIALNNRNAALLYNVAIDLVVPNAWTKPREVKLLADEQSHISVRNLPKGEPDSWFVPPDSIRVHQVTYGVAQGGLCVLLRYEATAALADTALLSKQGERLRGYVEEKFPEYAEVFQYLALAAFPPGNPQETWNHLYPLRRRS